MVYRLVQEMWLCFSVWSKISNLLSNLFYCACYQGKTTIIVRYHSPILVNVNCPFTYAPCTKPISVVTVPSVSTHNTDNPSEHITAISQVCGGSSLRMGSVVPLDVYKLNIEQLFSLLSIVFSSWLKSLFCSSS